MLINADAGTLSLFSDDGELLTRAHDPLDDKAMTLQARYHLLLRRHEYRRELVCRRCREVMAADNNINDDDQAWEILAYCACRALYGKAPFAKLPTGAPAGAGDTLMADEIKTIVAYEKQFLAAREIAEKLYCDRCYRENRHDGCRASVSENGFSGIVRIECRCRTIEHTGMTH